MAMEALRVVLAMLVAAMVAARGLAHKSLSPSGAITGFIVLSLTMSAGARLGALILAFYYSSSKLTKYKAEEKRNVDEESKEGGQRDWSQVLANSLVATVLSIFVAYFTSWQDKCLDTKRNPVATGLLGGILGYYACCTGDTWSSELGVLSKSQPRLITTLQVVPRGTNGGVSLLGLLAAASGGAFIGLTFFLMGMLTAECESQIRSEQWKAVPLGGIAGLLGSLMDSLLGATAQYSGHCVVRKKIVGKPGPTVRRISGFDILSNNAVNAISASLTSLTAAATCLYLFREL
ncbi:hypothetical protein O6H91_23G068500 [Diphasiastrum complanatum]|uniref:Uncharacterized protein n=1 Tax=Diphasiastrum complanatum TaxID=34168 RepID=A0ACC2ABR1_DIPCM|nr:hypothetical protein O6H91_23G068500 [Diphasiastrum complanatum]